MRSHTQDTLEARFGFRAAARLSESADALPHDINERLKAARFQAISRRKLGSRQQIVAAAGQHAGHISAHAGGSASLSGMPGIAGNAGNGSSEPPFWLRAIGFVLPGLVLAAALIGLSEWQSQQQIGTIAEIDAAMLADELPTQAYADPGFAQFLKAEAEAADNAAGI